DLDLIYKVPLSFHEQGMDEKIAELLGIWAKKPDIQDLKRVVFNAENPKHQVKMAMVGKYTDLIESYKSLNEALRHAALDQQIKLDIVYVDSEELEKSPNLVKEKLSAIDGILVPGGFGQRGTEG